MHATLRRTLFGGIPVAFLADLSLTAMRVFTGLALALAHGLGKVRGAGDPDGFVQNAPEAMGFPLPVLFGWMAALSEFAGGILLAVGLLTRVASFFVLSTMAVAAFYHHMYLQSDPFLGYERALLFLVIALQFIVLGGGRFSIDRFIRRNL